MVWNLARWTGLFAILTAGGCAHGAVSHPRAPALAVRVDAPALYPETLVWSPAHAAFLLGSVRRGGVHRVDDAGVVTPLVDDSRLSSVLGIAIDAARDRLWVTNADLGVATRPSAAGPKNVAAVGVYTLSTGEPLAYVDLAPLHPGPHLPNGIALDEDGRAYITDSFAPVVYRVALDAPPQVFARDPRFSGVGVGLNGVVVHPDGYLLVVKKSDGALFKVPLAAPAEVTRVATGAALTGGDGLLLTTARELLVIANRVPGAQVDAAFVLGSDDGWTSATLTAESPLGAVYPTTAALRDGRIWLLHSGLDALLASTPETRAGLEARAHIEPIGEVVASGARLTASPAAASHAGRGPTRAGPPPILVSGALSGARPVPPRAP